MSAYVKYRDVHQWVGLILLLPVCVIALTGFLWNHEKTLGLKAEPVAGVKEKPVKVAGKKSEQDQGDEKKLKAVTAPGEGQVPLTPGQTPAELLPALQSALAAAAMEWGPEAPLERIEFRQDPRAGLVVKVKIPETMEQPDQPYELVWAAQTASVIERKGAAGEGRDWAKVIHDLHTGKFFSKNYGYIWSDSAAGAILLLGITGVVLYLIPVFKKRAKRKRSPVPRPEGLRPRPTSVPAPVERVPALVAAQADFESSC